MKKQKTPNNISTQLTYFDPSVVLAGIVRCEQNGTAPAPEDLKAFPGNPFEHLLMLLRTFNESTPKQRRSLCVYLDPNDGWKPHWDDAFVDSIKHAIWDAAESPDDDGTLAEARIAKRNLKEVTLIIFPQDEERIAKDDLSEGLPMINGLLQPDEAQQ